MEEIEHVDALIEQGSVTEVRLTAHDLTVEELVGALLDAVERTGARRIALPAPATVPAAVAASLSSSR